MTPLHPLLARQLERLGLADGGAVASPEQWRQLLQRVSRAYQEADQERYLFERSQDLASAEMTELYGALEAEKAQLESRVSERTGKLARKRDASRRSATDRHARQLDLRAADAPARMVGGVLPAVRVRLRLRFADVRAGARNHSSRGSAARARSHRCRAQSGRERGHAIPDRARERADVVAARDRGNVYQRGRPGHPHARHAARHHAAEAGRSWIATGRWSGSISRCTDRISSWSTSIRRRRVPVGALERTARWRACGNVHDVRGADGVDARRRA